MRTMRLSELCSVQSGGTPRRNVPGMYGGTIPWAKIADLETADGLVSATGETITEKGLAAIRGRTFGPGALLLAMYGSVGKLARTATTLATNQAILGIEVRRNDLVATEYLRWWLQSIQQKLVHDARGVTQQNISASLVRELHVPLPDLSEQRRIADLLDTAGAIRRKRQGSLRLLDEFLYSAFLEMFGDPVANPMGWDVVRLEAIADVQGGLQVSAKHAGIGQQVPYLRVANVYRDRLDLGEIKSIFATEGEIERARLVAGDLLVVEGHGNPAEIGRSAVWDGSIGKCVHQNHLIRVRIDQRLAEPAYVSAVVNSASGRQQMLGFGKTTSGLNTISTRNVKSVQVPLPSLELQRRYASLRSRVQVVAERSATAEGIARELVASLTQLAFGEPVRPASLTPTARAC
jgi:type I restriction enzyme S subunit